MQTRFRRDLLPRALVAGLVLLLVLLLALIAASYVFDWQWTGFSDKRLFAWLQIFVFPAAVVIGTFVLNQAVREREQMIVKAQRQNEYRRDLLVRMTRAYNDTKKVRRLLKANIVTDRQSNVQEIACTAYEEQVQNLMDPQLEFEFLREQLRFLRGQPEFESVRERIEAISKQLGRMSNYPKRVIDEYESEKNPCKEAKSQPNVNGSRRIRLEILPNLKSFINRGPERNRFRTAFYTALDDIQRRVWNEQMTEPKS